MSISKKNWAYIEELVNVINMNRELETFKLKIKMAINSSFGLKKLKRAKESKKKHLSNFESTCILYNNLIPVNQCLKRL